MNETEKTKGKHKDFANHSEGSMAVSDKKEVLVHDEDDLKQLISTGMVKFKDIEGKLNFFDKGKVTKHELRHYLQLKDEQFGLCNQLFKKLCDAKNDVDTRQIALLAVSAVEELESQFQIIQSRRVLSRKDDLFGLMVEFAKMATRRLNQAEQMTKQELDTRMRDRLLIDIFNQWDKCHNNLNKGLDSYFENLENKVTEQNASS